VNDLISIIVPCYNVEKYVAKCMESILHQTYSNIEVIAVDDGSTDNTAVILRSFESDKRVRIINQPNSGVSAARNRGISSATGDFLAFVDSDDWAEPDMYEKLYNALTGCDADVAVCNYNLIYDDRVEKQYSKMREQSVDIYVDVYGYFVRFCACARPNNYLWTRLYRMDLVRKSGVIFKEYRLGDEVLFNFKLLPHLKKVAFIPDGLYNYYQRFDSNIYTVANKCNLAEVYADTFDALADYYRENGFAEFFEVLPIHAYTRLRSVFFYSRLAGMSDDKIVESLFAGFKGREIAKYLTGVAV